MGLNGSRSEPVAVANEHGHRLYRWTQDGQEWACCAHDHGPMCRRCRPVHGAIPSILDLVEQGFASVYDEDRGGWTFGPRDHGDRPMPALADLASRLTRLADEIDGRATGPDTCTHAAVAMRDAVRVFDRMLTDQLASSR